MSALEPATTDNDSLPASRPSDVPNKPRSSWKDRRILAGAFLLQFCAVGLIQSFGVFQDFYATTWLSHSTASDISWIGSVGLFLELSLGLVSGKLYDAGYFRSTVVAGCVLFTFSFFMLSLTKENHYYQVFLSQGLGMGLGLSLIFTPTSSLVGDLYPVKTGLAMGLVLSSAPLGATIFPIILNNLIHNAVGFAWAVRICAFITLGCFTLGCILILTSLDSKVSRKREPSASTGSLRSAKNAPYLLIVLSGFVVSLGTWFPSFYVQLFADSHGISSGLSFYAVTILSVSCAAGRIIPSHIADTYGAVNMYPYCVALNGMLGFAMLGCGNPAGLVLFCIFYGFFFGSTISMFFPVVVTLTPKELNMGVSVGLALTPVGIATLIGSPISGLILGHEQKWWRGVTFSSVYLLSTQFKLVANTDILAIFQVCLLGAAALNLAARQLYVKSLRSRQTPEEPPSNLGEKVDKENCKAV
ncbi:MFS general substrate transporter [Stereum hirsutum FP-91666 SS1]|uniref:MFS general substrate transporter n=1 Tax=Stereum hirsutum (strain FP-91666) TaxID=721885 RepID=UPI000440F80D|nr:MFS general substrate transporter [Stereum hirsutum FP-91666 SS1]EIM92159.1 MFS general substrate transporter [Stereum hirsutum FP-91666 SS1]